MLAVYIGWLANGSLLSALQLTSKSGMRGWIEVLLERRDYLPGVENADVAARWGGQEERRTRLSTFPGASGRLRVCTGLTELLPPRARASKVGCSRCTTPLPIA